MKVFLFYLKNALLRVIIVIISGVKLVSLEEALVADVVVLLVDHQEFKTIKPVFSDKQVLIDTRGIWN